MVSSCLPVRHAEVSTSSSPMLEGSLLPPNASDIYHPLTFPPELYLSSSGSGSQEPWVQTLGEGRVVAVLLSLLPEATMEMLSPLEMLYFVKCRWLRGNVILNVFFCKESGSENF